jgi:hypothetical protein
MEENPSFEKSVVMCFPSWAVAMARSAIGRSPSGEPLDRNCTFDNPLSHFKTRKRNRNPPHLAFELYTALVFKQGLSVRERKNVTVASLLTAQCCWRSILEWRTSAR